MSSRAIVMKPSVLSLGARAAGMPLVAGDHLRRHHGGARRGAADHGACRIAVVDGALRLRAAQRAREEHLVSTTEPHAGRTVEQVSHGIRVGLRAVDEDVDRAGAERAEILGLLLAAGRAVGARHGEHDDARAAGAAGEVDELAHERRGLRPAADDEQPPAARGGGDAAIRRGRAGAGGRQREGEDGTAGEETREGKARNAPAADGRTDGHGVGALRVERNRS
jgi:hypothetical protein